MPGLAASAIFCPCDCYVMPAVNVIIGDLGLRTPSMNHFGRIHSFVCRFRRV